MSQRYYVLLCLTLAYCLNFIDRQIFSVLAPLIKAEFALSDTVIGFLSGFAFALFYSILGIPLARLADRISPQKVIVAALLVWSGMTFLSSLTRSVTQLILCRIGVGIGEAGCTPPSHAIIARSFPQGERSTAMAIYYFGATLGMAFAFLLGGWLGDRFGWRTAFMIVGLPGVLLALVIKLTLPDFRQEQPASDESIIEKANFRETVLALFRCGAYRNVVAGTCLAYMAYSGTMQWVPSFFERTYDLPMTQIGLGLALSVGAASGIGSLVGGVLADRLSRTDVRWQLWVCAGACFVATWTNFGVYLSPSATTAFLWLAVPSFLIGLTTGPAFALAQALAPENARALASAILLFSTNFIGLGLGPQFVGVVSDYLMPSMGTDSLRYAILTLLLIGSLWASLQYYLGSLTLRRDLELATQ